ncbi:hypothetical protein ACYRFS_01040 [Listeria kieliensis]|uniref:Uncharacterized protein n=1 Tax=Listeria kieliensis TaxID=1621700 RepID=A0A3D8TV02_9LIST|nr:hypothetical protein [Listeria kieliensis]RDX02813.1 hypothetical protein UR08_04720 [Listeria kieliensis]
MLFLKERKTPILKKFKKSFAFSVKALYNEIITLNKGGICYAKQSTTTNPATTIYKTIIA